MVVSEIFSEDIKTYKFAPHIEGEEELSIEKCENNSRKEETDNNEPKKKKNSNKVGTEFDSEKSDDETKATVPLLKFTQLFRYANRFEAFLIIIGISAAFFAGLCMPGMIILFGRLTNAFVFEDLNFTDIIHHDHDRNWTHNETDVADADSFDVENILDLNKNIIIFGAGTCIIGLIQLVAGYIFVTSLNYAAEGQVFRIRGLFLKSILKQEIGYFDTHETNDFASRVTEDLNKVQEGIGEKIGMFVFFMTTFIGSMVNAFFHGWQLTLVILSVFPLVAVSTGVIAKLQASFTSIELKEYAKAGCIAEEVISSIRTVISFGGEEKEIKRYEENLVSAKSAGIKRGLTTGLGAGVLWFLIYASYALAFWYGTKLILESRPPNEVIYTPKDLIVVFFSVLTGAMNIGQSAPYVEAFNIARGAAAQIFKIIERSSEIDPTSDDGDKLLDATGTIELKNIDFTYPSRPDVKILHGVNFRINPGETVALVGSSGCGKSTCIQLIQRFYDPQSGEVTFDGHNIKKLNLGWLRDQIGIVGQEPVLFGTTILENIRYGKEFASFKEVQDAAKEANAHDFIMKLPKNYHTQVGERGVQMSGGQKQRIAIARALIKRPKVLLLDEATSALDNESEAVVQRALDKVSEGRTTIIVAHRLSTIKQANLIIAMQNGKIIETGTHEQLMQNNDYYKSLVTAQLSKKEMSMYGNNLTSEVQGQEQPDASEILDEIVDDIITKSPIYSSPSFRLPIKRRISRNLSTSSASSHTSLVKTLPKSTAAVEDEDYKDVPITEILKMNSSEWYFIVGGVIGAVVQGVIIPTFAILFGNVLSTLAIANADEAREKANKYSLGFLIVGIVAAVSTFFQSYMFAISGEILTMKLRKRTFTVMLQQEIGWFDEEKNSVGALCSRLSSDASSVQGATGSRVGTVVQSITTLIFGVTVAFYFSLQLGSVMLPFIPFILVACYVQQKVIMGQSVTEAKVLEDAGKIAVEAITNIRTIASLHKEELAVSLYVKALHDPHIKARKTSHIRGLAFGFAQSVPYFAYAAVMFYGGYLISNDKIEYKVVFIVSESLIFGTMMVGQAMAFAPNYSKAKVSASRLVALFNRVPQIDSSSDVGEKMKEELKLIHLSDVQFKYPTRPGLLILKGIGLEVSKGQKVALVGSSGCGKSTIINILERFYEIHAGLVKLNSNKLDSLNVGYARSLFGLVSQEPVLFDRTISENIAYGDNSRTFSENDIIEVAKQANIHDFISSLPDGYQTRVGAKGTQLSGGQKQRIAIARALIRNPQVLLLDEATSALDAESEKVVQETLDKVQRDRTSIIIAHRLSTIRDVDKIIVIDAGQVVEEGTHLELINRRGHYWQLYNATI